MAELLVSVRSVQEAAIALDGGAALIDVKEPARGALGRADTSTIRAVAEFVAGRRPVSAALGEWTPASDAIPALPVDFVKWGLAGCQREPTWRDTLDRLLRENRKPRLVLVAYADWECAGAPALDDVFKLAEVHPGSVVLVDTHCKDASNPLKTNRPTLLDWLPVAWVESLVARAPAARVRVALAGSLGIAEIRALLPAQPDWFAVRGAVCADGERGAEVQLTKVKELAAMLRQGAPNPARAS